MTPCEIAFKWADVENQRWLREDIETAIREAILAEREACAKIGEQASERGPFLTAESPDYQDGYARGCIYVVERIRARPEP